MALYANVTPLRFPQGAQHKECNNYRNIINLSAQYIFYHFTYEIIQLHYSLEFQIYI